MPDHQTDTIHCPHAEDCGACALLGVAYPAQLGRKRRLLGRALKRYHSLAAAELRSCLASPLIGIITDARADARADTRAPEHGAMHEVAVS